MPGNGIGPVHAHTAARGNPASNPTPESSEPRCTASGSPNAVDVRTPSGSLPRTTASKPRSADGTDTPTADGANTMRKRNEKNNTHHTRHHRHMHGARRMRERVGAFDASACGQVNRLAMLRHGRRIQRMRHHPDRHEASGLRRLLGKGSERSRTSTMPATTRRPCP